MLEKNEFLKTSKEFAYRIRNCRNSAIHLGGTLVLGETVLGNPIIIDSRHFNSLKLLYLPPSQEIAIMSYLFHFIKPGMQCLDFGAGTGYYSLVLAKLSGINGIVWSFENEMNCYQLLKRNIQLNAFAQICSHAQLLNIDSYLENKKINFDFIHIFSEAPLPDTFAAMQQTIKMNRSLHLLCHICPRQLESSPDSYDHFFQSLSSDGFEGYLFPNLNRLESKAQLTKDLSLKSLLLCRGSLWIN